MRRQGCCSSCRLPHFGPSLLRRQAALLGLPRRLLRGACRACRASAAQSRARGGARALRGRARRSAKGARPRRSSRSPAAGCWRARRRPAISSASSFARWLGSLAAGRRFPWPSSARIGRLPSSLPRRIPRLWAGSRRTGAGTSSRDPTATRATRPDGSAVELLRFFDGKKFTPILFLATGSRRDRADRALRRSLRQGFGREPHDGGETRLRPEGSRDPRPRPLARGARRGAPARRAAGRRDPDAGRGGAERGLTAEEIVARERAWDAGQRALFTSYIAHLKTSLRFKVGEVGETFDLSILGPLFYRRGEPADWEWDEFYLNGVKWKGKTLPKLPILQPEKVTAIPLDIRLTEDYEYTLKGEGTMSGRPAYHVAFAPKQVDKDKATYRGSVWIDKETFALLRRNSVQMNLKGETLSAVQTEYYSPVPGNRNSSSPRDQGRGGLSRRPAARRRSSATSRSRRSRSILPISRTCARRLTPRRPDDPPHRARDALPRAGSGEAGRARRRGEDLQEEHVRRRRRLLRRLAGLSRFRSLGVQHFNFDLWGKGKQLSVFFAGALLTANYTDPALAGRASTSAPTSSAWRSPSATSPTATGKEVPAEKIKHLPAAFQVNVGHPIGPYLKASLGLFTKWDNFQRDKDTGPNFVTPVDTFTDGAELRLVANFSGFNIAATGSAYLRQKWEFWGDPATSEFDPDQQDYQKWSAVGRQGPVLPGVPKAAPGNRVPRRPRPRPLLQVRVRELLGKPRSAATSPAASGPRTRSSPTSPTA